MICLDTNAAIAALRGVSPLFNERFSKALLRGELAISTVVLFELHFGIAKSARRIHNTQSLATFLHAPIAVLPFETEDAEEAGQIRAGLEQAGTPIGPYDLLIAAQARRRSAVLITANLSEFSRVPRLLVEDWS